MVGCGRSVDDDVAAVWLRTRSNRPAIPPEEGARLYDLFFTTKKTGTGFGLDTAKKIVARNGGAIALRVAEKRGTMLPM